MDLDHRHPDWTATLDLRTRSRHLYEGEAAVKAEGETYLIRGDNEALVPRADQLLSDYHRRLEAAVLDPYVEKVIQARQAVIFGGNHTRDLPAVLEPWRWDVDRRGTPAATFFAQVARDAQVDGIAWVAVDMPTPPEGGFRSRLDEQRAGARPFFEHLPGEAVIDWQVGADGLLDWAVVKMTVPQARPMWGEAHRTKEQWKAWTRTDWHLYERGSTADAQYIEIAAGPNTSGQVPLVPFLGERRTDQSGWPVTKRILGYVLSIYNKQSDRDWFERLTCHPIPVQIGPEPLTKMDVMKGIFLRSMPGHDVSVGYLEPSGASFGSIRETIHDYQARVYQIALAQAKRDSAQVQSADAQREDRRAFTTGLKDCSRQYEAAEQRCWELMARWAGADPGEVAVQYSRDFDEKAIEAAMIGALGQLVDQQILTRRTVLRALVDGDVVEVEDIDAELDAAKQEAEAATAELAIRTANQLKAEAQAAAAAGAPDDGGQRAA